MGLGFNVDEASSCSVCRATVESFAPYHESKPNGEPLPHWRLKLGNPIALRDQTSCSTCQKVWDVLLDYESRLYFRDKDPKREGSWFSDDAEVEIAYSRTSGYELSKLCGSSAVSPGLKSRSMQTRYRILRLRPHIPLVLRLLSESYLVSGQDTSPSKRSNSQVVDNQYPTWYAKSQSETQDQYKWHFDDPSPPLDFGIVLPEGPIDTSRIRRWIEYCDDFHEKCRPHLHGAPQSEVMPAFLIDIKQLCIAPCPSTRTKYATLSYVWGQATGTIESKLSNILNLCKHNSLSSEDFVSLIPRTIRDAIKLCQLIGIDFLWVDRLCIVQDDKNMVHDQIGAMGKIFKNSYLTIICADGEDVNHGLPGVDDASRKHEPSLTLRFSSTIQFSVLKYKESKTSPHHQRAWTFQERMLSPRTLVFHDQTVYWECLSCSIQETCSADDNGERDINHEQFTNSHTGRTQEFPAFAIPESLVLSERPIPDLKAYWSLVRGYSKRSLSYQSDAEKAFGAVIQEFSRAFDGGFFYGIPTLIFDYCLFWSFAPGSVPKRREGFPSWSWLGWETEVLLHPFWIDSEDVWQPSRGDYCAEREAWNDPGFWSPMIAFYRTQKDGTRVRITNPSFNCVFPQKCKYTEDWRAHSFLYFSKKDDSGRERVFYPDRDHPESVHQRNITKDRLFSADVVEEMNPTELDLQGWSKQEAFYFLHQNWPNKRFFHPFPVVNHPETDFESSKNWDPYLEFRAHSYTLKPVQVHNSQYERRALLLEHEAFPGVIVGDLQPDNPQEVDSLLGCSCQLVITSVWGSRGELNMPYLLHSEYFTPARWVYAALWIEWKDGVAYRKGVGAIFGPADPMRPVGGHFSPSTTPIFQRLDDTVKRGVDLFKEWPAEMVEVRLG
ncbi:HET-domain-containing protein [Hyaloscypha variabilis F]|uniref:HET-domain-containing protein n=1 Tax=Hyaloscypha variabilis (strain UAMH 11265 / GT02V1 / F) TaxID=1149755 RepID=A0A2J6RYY7_HYAVF|nr:HET-domain-containing protein [Hyaloscypha variabilis F]